MSGPRAARKPRSWLGVDPGGVHSGLLTLIDDDLVDVFVLDLEPDELPVEYMQRVVARARAMFSRLERRPTEGGIAVALEGVVPITPHVKTKPINPTYLMHTALTLGGLAATFPDAVIVRPGGHGSQPMGTYPLELVSDGERRRKGWQLRAGTGSLRHARSAYDVVRAAKSPIYAHPAGKGPT